MSRMFFFESRSLIFWSNKLAWEALLIFSWEERISSEISFFRHLGICSVFRFGIRLEFRCFPWFGPKQDFPHFSSMGVGREKNQLEWRIPTDSVGFHFNSFLDRSWFDCNIVLIIHKVCSIGKESTCPVTSLQQKKAQPFQPSTLGYCLHHLDHFPLPTPW